MGSAGTAGEASSPVPVQMATPVYPRLEACAGLGGTVVLVLRIDATGAVDDVVIERSSRNRDMDRSAAAAARTWNFASAGSLEARRVRVPVNFQPRSYRAESCPDIRLQAAGEDAIPGAVFRSNDVVHVLLPHALPGARTVEARWYRLDGVEAGTASTSVQARDGQPVDVALPPAEGWAPGRYAVNVFIDDERTALALFDVE
jgi:TonB family protein